MAKPYSRLRGLMVEHDLTQPQLARKLDIGYTAMSQKMNARKSFSLEECYEILDLFDLPYDQLIVLFPRVPYIASKTKQ